ncbi:MAG: MoxR family ATPase [Gammaproteobacteria bacterium]|nr:MoxR family ATPase [Gammaproteobacteria bacterium]
MSKLFYSADRNQAIKPLSELPEPAVKLLANASRYYASEELVVAVNVALILGQPLLLTGEPGTGKSQLAYHVAWRLGLEPLLQCQVRSTTTYSELFYQFDELTRFRDSQPGKEEKPLVEYLRLNGLGKAILFAGGPDAELTPIPGSRTPQGQRPLTHFRDLLGDAHYPANAGQATVVLIDELDKAPRDTPNDMLDEIEKFGFDIPELGVRVQLPEASTSRPIVIITSNSEKSLPDAFLRRCAYYHIPFPDTEVLKPIVYSHLPALQERETWLHEALDLFAQLRNRGKGIRKPPGTAELLSWLRMVCSLSDLTNQSLKETLRTADGESNPNVQRLLNVLIKTKEEWDIAKRIISDWAQ